MTGLSFETQKRGPKHEVVVLTGWSYCGAPPRRFSTFLLAGSDLEVQELKLLKILFSRYLIPSVLLIIFQCTGKVTSVVQLVLRH